ncbi:MAG: flagellar hook capping FlgD N-terminal domain-containing protein [Pirellulaceae bacterium]|nr:flagellar hook capping FlgD N-terminal domain-containing protein [Pirellulaceae bacterium]
MQLAGISSSQLEDQFLTLLVTQLQNQDPMEPVKQEDFIGQLAQFSTVEGIEKLNSQFSEVLQSQQMLGGFDLVGKDVSYIAPGDAEPSRGHVDQVLVENGNIKVVMGDKTIPVNQVFGVFDPATG